MRRKNKNWTIGCRPRNAGWTLVELLVTIAIIGILLLIGYIAVKNGQNKARVALAKSDMANLSVAINAYQLENGKFPNPEQHAAFLGLAGRHESPGSFSSAPTLTSPMVFYSKSMPYDPFDNAGRPFPRLQSYDITNDAEFCVGRYDYYSTDKGFILASNGPIGMASPGIEIGIFTPLPKRLIPGDKILVSEVVEDLYFYEPHNPSTGSLKYFQLPPGCHYFYDPSNGSFSQGNIFVVGP